MMKKRPKTKNNHQMQVDRVKAEWLQLMSWGKKQCQMESHAWVRLWEMCSGILQRQKKKKPRKVHKTRSFQPTFHRCRLAQQRHSSAHHLLFSPVETQTGREAERCQTTRHIFSPQVKRQLRRSADPRKWDRLQAVLLISYALWDHYSLSSLLKKKTKEPPQKNQIKQFLHVF